MQSTCGPDQCGRRAGKKNPYQLGAGSKVPLCHTGITVSILRWWRLWCAVLAVTGFDMVLEQIRVNRRRYGDAMAVENIIWNFLDSRIAPRITWNL